MNCGENNIHVLITTTSLEAKGGIVALHQVLFGQPVQNNFQHSIFQVSSPKPFTEQWDRRFFRVISRVLDFRSMLVNNKSINIVHINTAYDFRAMSRDMFFIIIAWLQRKKIVLQIHSTIDDGSTRYILKWIVRYVFPLCNIVLVFSKEDYKKMTNAIPKVKVEIFQNAVNVEYFSKKDMTLKRELSIPEDGKIVLFLSRMIKEKGVYELIEAIPLVLQNYKNVYFLFAGDGPEKLPMESICKENGFDNMVRFTGHIQDIELLKAFSCADIFVLPSYQEGLPMVILQALAAGLPILSTPSGAIPDIIRNGLNGYLIEPRSPKQIAEKILLLLNREDFRTKMRVENILLAKNKYDRNIILDKLEQLYVSL